MFSPLLSLTPWEIAISVLDIAIVAYVFYRIFLLIRGTRAVQLIKGIILLLIAFTITDWLELPTINWLLEKATLGLVVAIPVVFQPELRRALEQLGRGQLFRNPLQFLQSEDISAVIKEVVKSLGVMARNHIGAIIVFQRQTGLKEVIETGTEIDAALSSSLLVNLFIPKTPLHDGAVIIAGNRVVAAGCFLPLSDNPNLGPELGTRHRAALGMSEQSDAVILVVSEETGTVSLANGGKLIRDLDEKTLEEMLNTLLQPEREQGFGFWNWGGGG